MLRITVNLAPADLKKEGPSYDLPIAIGLMTINHQVDPNAVSRQAMIGELALESVSAMSGYLGDEAATSAAFVGSYLKTGDLGYTRDGEFFWSGRSRERITVRGRKVDPSEFESVLLTVPRLRAGSFAAFGIDDSSTGTQKLVIVGETRDESPDTADEVRRAVRRVVFERLGLGVDQVVLVKSGTLAKTSSGKRRHQHFRELYERGDLKSFEVGV